MKNELFISMLPFETERLVIRKVSVDDVDLMLKMDKQEETQLFLGGVKNKSREDRLTLLKSKEEKFNNGHASMLTVCLKNKTPIGFTALTISDESNNAELSYLYDYEYTKKGYCTETCNKLIDIAFNELNLDKVYADMVDGNNNSKRVLEKLGFKQIGIRKKDVVFLDYELLADDYKMSKNQ